MKWNVPGKRKPNQKRNPEERENAEDDELLGEAEEILSEPEANLDNPADAIRQKRALVLRRRKVTQAAKRVLRTRRMNLLLWALIVLIIILFLIAAIQERMGNFTINLNRLDMYRRGIMLSSDDEFNRPASRLKADAVRNATNIAMEDLPENIDQIDGSHNGDDYVAYTFYLKNGGKETVDYYANVVIDMTAKGVDEATWVAVYDQKGKRTVYAKRNRSGQPEPGTTPFVDDDLVMEHYVKNFKVGDVHKYTVVIWLEGNDPDCVDAIIGGMIRMEMDIQVADPIDPQK